MASEVSHRHSATGETLYFTIRNTTRQMWNTGGTPNFETLTVANWTSYKIAMSESPASSYFYAGTFPAISGNMVAGWYWCDVFKQAGGSAAIGDTLYASYHGYWDGTTYKFWGDDTIAIKGTPIGGTGTQVADAFTSFFNVASPTGTVNSLPAAVPGASNGVFIAGSNAATTLATWTVTGATTFTGNVAAQAGITVTQSTANGAGLSVTGNGTGTGMQVKGGATGTGLTATCGDSGGNYGAIIWGGLGSATGMLLSGGDAGGYGVRISSEAGNEALRVETDAAHAISIYPGGDGKHGLNIVASGSSNAHGVYIEGGSGGTSDGIHIVAGTGGVGVQADTVTTSGAVTLNSLTVSAGTTLTGAVTATHASNDIRGVKISGTLTTLDAVWAKIQKWLRLGFRKDAAVAADHATELSEINADGGSGSGTFDNTTDATEAIRDSALTQTQVTGGAYPLSDASFAFSAALDLTTTQKASVTDAVPSNVKKNTALAAFQFVMIDSTTKVPVTGKTVTVTRSIDGGAFAAGTLSAVAELSNGVYGIDFAAADLNGNVILLLATATGCDPTIERILTTP